MSQQAGAKSARSIATTFTIDRDRVMYETLDDETIVIDLSTGTYYSIGGCGVELWAAVVEGTPLGTLVERMEGRFPDVAGLSTMVEEWVAGLGREGLVQIAGPTEAVPARVPEIPEKPERQATPTTPGAAQRQYVPDPLEGASPGRFRPPVLSRYTDMQALLLLDPVHEVDAGAGWPNAPIDRS